MKPRQLCMLTIVFSLAFAVWRPFLVKALTSPTLIPTVRDAVMCERLLTTAYAAEARSLTLAEFSKKWSGNIIQMRIQNQNASIDSNADLEQLQQLVLDFPGVLLRWQFSAETGLTHHLEFQIAPKGVSDEAK